MQNFVLCSAATEKQFFDQINIRLFSQLMTGISSVLEKLLIYFNGTIISTSFVLLFPVCPVICCLNLNEILLPLSAKKLVITLLLFKVVSFLQHCYKLSDVFEQVSLYSLNHTYALLYQYHEHYVPVYYLFHLPNQSMEHNL